MTTGERHILVAEDNLAMAHVLRFNLQHAGYQVSVARTGLEALKLAEAGVYDLVITDQQMPEMNGQQFCRGVRDMERYAETPIIMLTAKSLELDETQLREELGITRLFSKPFSPTEVIQAVRECLASPAT